MEKKEMMEKEMMEKEMMEKLYYTNIGDGEVVVSGVEILVRKIRPILMM